MEQHFNYRLQQSSKLLAIGLLLPFLWISCTGKKGNYIMKPGFKDSIIALQESAQQKSV